MITLLLAALQALTPLAALNRDIANLTSAPIYIVRDPETPPDHPRIAAWLASPGFRAQLQAAHALTINLTEPSRAHAIVFNPAFAEQYALFEAELLAHELGHVWLAASGYSSIPFPAAASPATACLAVQAADIPQHELLRREMTRRGVPYDGYWQNNLRLAVTGPARPGSCERMIAISQWLDLRLGAAFDDGPRIEAALRERYPDLMPLVERIEPLLRDPALADAEGYRNAVRTVFTTLATLLEQSGGRVPENVPPVGDGGVKR